MHRPHFHLWALGVLPAAWALAQARPAPALKQVTVPELVARLAARDAVPVDANPEGTRAKLGTLPGAIRLTSSLTYRPEKELPRSKRTPLVFYCLDARCEASTFAAKKALEAGYTEVAVLPEGISGWRRAGQPTEQTR